MNKPGHLTSPLLSGGQTVHAFLSRQGGVSEGQFSTLNFDLREGDTVDNVKENRARVSAGFGIDFEKIFTVNQVHGDDIHVLNGSSAQKVDADAIITDMKNIPIGIMTADCLPVLLFDPVNKAIGVVHAGWKGTVKGISMKAVAAMRENYGSTPKNIIAVTGPYIGPCCYTVGEGVLDEFKKSGIGNIEKYFKRDGAELKLDIGPANKDQLLTSGIPEKNIGTVSPCTSCSDGLFFSYRRDGGKTGRQISFIMLR